MTRVRQGCRCSTRTLLAPPGTTGLIGLGGGYAGRPSSGEAAATTGAAFLPTWICEILALAPSGVSKERRYADPLESGPAGKRSADRPLCTSLGITWENGTRPVRKRWKCWGSRRRAALI